VNRHVDELARHVRRLGNHELNELLLQLPKPRFAALVEVALARPVLPAGVVLRFEPTPGVDGWSVVACAPRRRLGALTRDRDPDGRPGPDQRDLKLAASLGCGRRPGLGDPGQWSPLSGPGRPCPRPSRGGLGQRPQWAASGPVRSAGGGGLRECGVGGMTAVKRCPRCRQVQAAEEFYRRRGGRRLSSYCRSCTRVASQDGRLRRRQDPGSAERLRGVDRVRQRRHRALGRRGGEGS
jgi:hypothetical protein